MPDFESAWAAHPGYTIDIEPWRGTARVFAGDLIVAESDKALLLKEAQHVDRIYLPRSDVRLELFEPTDHHSVCPFKGQADYWSLVAGDERQENIVWSYPDTFEQVAPIEGYIGIYHEKLRVELEEQWPGTTEPRDLVHHAFPVWGDEELLVELLDVAEVRAGHYEVPAYPKQIRNVVEGSQMLGQAIVAASKAVPGQRVSSAYIACARAAGYETPLDIEVNTLHRGRQFSSISFTISQDDKLRCPGTMLLATDVPDMLHVDATMPEVPGPYDSVPHDMSVTGRDLRIVDDAYDPDPDRIGPPEIYAWMRFRRSPDELYLRQALLAQATGHWTLGAAMRPTPGYGEAQAHVTLSTGIMSISIAFHDDAPVDQWFLYANPAIWAGRGLAQGDGRIFTQDGRLLASYGVQALLRPFEHPPEQLGKDYTNAM